MTAGELEKWLGTEESKAVGQKDGDAESTGHASGRRIVELLRTKKDDLSDDDLAHMRTVHGYVQRHLAQEPASEIKPFLEQRPSVIRVHASHGFAVAKLREFLDREPGIGVDLRYVSNQHSLVSLAQGACDLSGLHLPHGALRAQGIKAAREWLDPREDRIISFVTREMGLMVARGNPLRIASLQDLTGPKVRFVNRDHDSGTRLLFDQLLATSGIDESRINGAQQIEFTHAAVAAYVASGMADASFGVEAAARHFGLDFIRLLTEDYFFVCKRAFLDTAPMQRILEIIRSADFRAAVATLPGYVPSDTGSVTGVKAFLEMHAVR